MKRFSLISGIILSSSFIGFADPLPEPAPLITPATTGFNLDWDGSNGNTYFVECSSDLVTWQFMPAIKSGVGGPLGYGFGAPDDRLFFRLKYTDVATSNALTDDFDNDGISNWDEVRIGGSGTNPFNPDTDGDGVLDGNEDSNGNGLSDKFEFNLVGNWKLDEEIGNSVISDSSTNLLDGDLLTGTRIPDGVHGSAVSLNATQQMKVTPAVGQLNVGDNGSDFTVSFWIRLHENHEPGWNTILQKGNTSNKRTFGIYLQPDGQKIHARITSSSSTNEGIDESEHNMVPQEWTHVAYVYGEGRLKLYINGHLDSSVIVSTAIANDDPFYIGKSNWLGGVNADFDEIHIHRCSLTALEVNQLVNTDSDGDGLPDIWERLWAQNILDTVDLSTLTAEQITQLQQGDVDSSIDYNGDGLVSGENYKQATGDFAPMQYTYEYRRESWVMETENTWGKEYDTTYEAWSSGFIGIEEYAHFTNGGDVMGQEFGHQIIGEYRLKLKGGGTKNHSKTFIITRTKDDWAMPVPEGGTDPMPPVTKFLGTVTYSVADDINKGKVKIELSLDNDSEQTITVEEDTENEIPYLRIEPTRLTPTAQDVINSYNLLPVEIVVPKLNAQGAEIAGELVSAKELKVAKWENAFLGGSTNGSVKENFIGLDRDRFYVRIPNGVTLGISSVEIATEDNLEALYNDDATEIDVTDLGDGETAMTESMILVSDDYDDDYAANGAGADDQKNDRTHKIQLGGNLVIKSVTIKGKKHEMNMKIPVPAKKEVDVDFYRMNVDGVHSEAQIKAAMKFVKERYAQCALRVNAHYKIANWPQFLIDQGGEEGVLVSYQGLQLSSDYKGFIDQVDTQGVNIFYCIHAYASAGVAIGWKQVEREGVNGLEMKYLNNAFINKLFGGGMATTAHELLHLLSPHPERDDHAEAFHNILVTSAQNVNQQPVLFSKRINSEQQERIYSHFEVRKAQ